MNSPDRITKLFSGPKPCTVGGVVYPVSEFRIEDLVTLQAWLDNTWDDPLDAIEEKLVAGGLTTEEVDDLLYSAIDRAEIGPLVEGTPEAIDKFCTTEGLTVFLLVALSRHRPKTKETLEEMAALALNLTQPELLKLRRVCFGTSTLRALTLMVMGNGGSGNGTGTWQEAIDAVARSHHWTYAYIRTLTLTEFVNARREGKPIDETAVSHVVPEREGSYAAYLERKKLRDEVKADG